MTDPERLIASGSEFERSLLLEAASEKPSALLLTKMESGLGLAQSATVASALGGKLVALVIGTALLGGGAMVALGDEAPTAVASAGMGSRVAAMSEAAAVQATVPVLEDAPRPTRTELLPGHLDEVGAKAPSKPAASPAEASHDRLSEEVALLDRVRGALRDGNAVLARRHLETYERRFPNGVLAPEARKLRRSANSNE